MRSILRSVSNSSKASTNSSDLSVTYSDPRTPPATPERRPSHGSDMGDDVFGSPTTRASGLLMARRQTGAGKRVAFDSRALALPPPQVDPAGFDSHDKGHNSPLLPEASSRHASRTIELPNGASFVGVSSGPDATGWGTITYANGDRYEGDVAHGFAHGAGVYRHAADGTSFRGTFDSGRQAKGMQAFEGGFAFDGAYQGNAAMGPGYLFDDKGFLLRASFVDGRAHGPGHVRYRSGDSFLGAFDYGRLAMAPGVVRYPDGRVGLRLVSQGLASIVIVAHQADEITLHNIIRQEHALNEEAWLALVALREEMLHLVKRGGVVALPGLPWSIMPWTPAEAQIRALAGILTCVGDHPGHTQRAMRDLLRGLLHLLGPARPYMTVGDVEGATEYQPASVYANMLAFMKATILPHFGTSRIYVRQATAPDEANLELAYRLDGEPGFAQRLQGAVDAVVTGLTAAFTLDQAQGDAQLGHSRTLLCSVLDGTRRFDARLHAMRHALTHMGLADALLPVPPGAHEVSRAPECRPPLVVAAAERGCSVRRLHAQQHTGQAPFRTRARSASVGSHSGLEEACRLSPMPEVSDGASSKAPESVAT